MRLVASHGSRRSGGDGEGLGAEGEDVVAFVRARRVDLDVHRADAKRWDGSAGLRRRSGRLLALHTEGAGRAARRSAAPSAT